jgi:archaemetzincin
MRLAIRSAFAALVCMSVLAEGAQRRAPTTSGGTSAPHTSAATAKTAAQAADRIRPLHARMAPIEPGDWLADHPENGQTFAQYLNVRPRELGTRRQTIYLVPLGKYNDAERQVMHETAEFLSLFYWMPVQWRDPIADNVIPDSARRINEHTRKTQFDSIYILQKVLPDRVPRDAAALLALTATDLWPGDPKWNFVYGQGSLGQPTGVWSMARLGKASSEEERKLRLYRMIKIATHETGHLFGIPHCTSDQCGMNGSNGQRETDAHPLAFCPECEAKIWLVTRVNPAERYRRLAALAQRHGFETEESLFKRSAEALERDK